MNQLHLATGMLLAFACGACSASHTPPTSFGEGFAKVPASPEIHAREHAMAERLNRDRAEKGLDPLIYDEELADIGRAHSKDMHDHSFFAHESPNTGTLDDRIARAGYLALEARENLAEGPTVDAAQDGLLASPGHYANIMSETVSHIGIGIVEGGVEDPSNLLFTQVFTRPGIHESTAQVSRRLDARIAEQRQAAGLPPLSRHQKLDRLAEEHIDSLPDQPSPGSLKQVGKAVAASLAEKPIAGVSGVSVSGQLLWQADQYEPSSAIASASVRHYGMALREVTDEKGRPQIKLLILFGI